MLLAHYDLIWRLFVSLGACDLYGRGEFRSGIGGVVATLHSRSRYMLGELALL